MPDVFLSYSREDQATARRFAEGLEREGFTVWWDQTLRSGEAYDEVTEQALKAATAVVVLWSKASVASRWVRAEATIADRRGTLLPVMIEACDRPVMFELTQAADLTHWKGGADDAAWRAFLGDVRRHVGKAEAPRPLALLSGQARRTHGWKFRLTAAAIVLALLGAWVWSLFAVHDAAAPDAIRTQSIAVMPFEDMTGTGNYASLGEGLADELSTWLGHLPDLRVKDYQSASEAGGADADVRRIGERLGVKRLVKGSMRRGQDLLRVTVQLVATDSGEHLWSDTFNIPDSDALRIEDIISRKVAEELNARLSPETERRWKARQATVVEARGLYLEGRTEFRRRTAESNLRALELYRRAVEADRRFPLAYVSLAEALLNSVNLNGRNLADAAAEAGPLLQQALVLSPDMPEAIAVQGGFALDQYRKDEALMLLRRALALNPNDATTQRRMGNLQVLLAQPKEALASFDAAADLDPLDFLTQVYRCLGLLDLAEFTGAEAACARARELDASNPWGPYATAWLHLASGDLGGALRWINRAVGLAPGNTTRQAQRIQILRELRREDAVRASIAGLPPSAEPTRSFLQAVLAVDHDDLAGLRVIAEGIARRSGLTASEWLRLGRMQVVAGNLQAARVSLRRARESADWLPDALADPYYVRYAYLPALVAAEVAIATGDREAGIGMLDRVDAMLDAMERGGAGCYGLYLLRAESLALRGDADRAMDALQRAYQQGWRQAQAVRTESPLQALRLRADFQALLAKIDREVRSIQVDVQALPP